MNNQTNSIRLSQNKKALVVTINGQTALFNVNLVKYHLEIPYTKKDGTQVDETKIFDMKSRAKEAYAKKLSQPEGKSA